jgi:hypothetical protein
MASSELKLTFGIMITVISASKAAIVPVGESKINELIGN